MQDLSASSFNAYPVDGTAVSSLVPLYVEVDTDCDRRILMMKLILNLLIA